MPMASKAFFLFNPAGNERSPPRSTDFPFTRRRNTMRRELTIRCVSRGTIRTEGPPGVRCRLREIWLELDGAPARVQIMDSCDRGQHARDSMIELEGISVRIRTGHDVKPPT